MVVGRAVKEMLVYSAINGKLTHISTRTVSREFLIAGDKVIMSNFTFMLIVGGGRKNLYLYSTEMENARSIMPAYEGGQRINNLSLTSIEGKFVYAYSIHSSSMFLS